MSVLTSASIVNNIKSKTIDTHKALLFLYKSSAVLLLDYRIQNRYS